MTNVRARLGEVDGELLRLRAAYEAPSGAYVRAEALHTPADGGAPGLPGAMAAMSNPIFLGAPS